MKRKSSLALMLFTFLPIVFCGTLAQAQSSSKTKAGSESAQSDGQDSSRIVSVTSQQSFDKTYDSLKKMIESKGLKVLAEIDHAKNAKTADMTLPPTKVILFGNPKMGTPLMKANQSMALDLPQRMAVYEDDRGAVHIVYNDPKMVAKDHKLTGQDKIIAKVSGALKKLAGAAAKGGDMKKAANMK